MNDSKEKVTDTTKSLLGSPIGSIAAIRKIIVIYSALLVLLIGYPWFYFTTTIHRATLPTEEIDSFVSKLNELKVTTPVAIELSNAREGFIERVQQEFDTQLYTKYPNLRDFWAVEFKRIVDSSSNEYDELLKVTMDIVEDDSAIESYFVSPFDRQVDFKLTNKVILSKKVEAFIANTLLDEVFVGEVDNFNLITSDMHKASNVVLPYSSSYNLIVSLMIEDGRPMAWSSETIHNLLEPLLTDLQHITNITISTQIQYYSKLQVDRFYNDETNSYVLREADLSNFINFGDWNLNNNDINPSINFIVYYPSSNHENIPTIIENSKVNSFLIPQYGGLFIKNKVNDVVTDDDEIYIVDDELVEILEVFSSQLFKLLGIQSSKPKNLKTRIDSLTRLTVVQNMKQAVATLKSLIKLTNDLHEISIPELTKSYVSSSLQNLQSAIEAVELKDFKKSLIDASIGLKDALSAFFDKDIVQQVYFPSEHKLAVFLPLVGPLCSILLFSTIRQIKEMKQNK